MNQPTNQPPPSRYQPPYQPPPPPPSPPQGYSQPPPRAPQQPAYRGPAKMAHGAVYWTLIGWWWGPTKWAGRMLLWLFLWPVGLWRSIRHHQDTVEGRQRRGYR